MPILKIPLLKLAYLTYRKNKKRSKLCVIKGGRIGDLEYEKIMQTVNEIKNGK